MPKWLRRLVRRFHCRSNCCINSDCIIEPTTPTK